MINQSPVNTVHAFDKQPTGAFQDDVVQFYNFGFNPSADLVPDEQESGDGGI